MTHFKQLSAGFDIEIDSEHCIKEQEDAVQKIKREAPITKGGEKECFNNLKDILRSRVTVHSQDKLKQIVEYF